jgi:hypothetical protein
MKHGHVNDGSRALLRHQLLHGRVPRDGIRHGYRPVVRLAFSLMAIHLSHSTPVVNPIVAA